MATKVDGFAVLLEVIDRRARAFGPDRSGVLGRMSVHPDGDVSVILDDGREIPNPVLTFIPNGDPERVVVIWMQDGHDACVIRIHTPGGA